MNNNEYVLDSTCNLYLIQCYLNFNNLILIKNNEKSILFCLYEKKCKYHISRK